MTLLFRMRSRRRWELPLYSRDLSRVGCVITFLTMRDAREWGLSMSDMEFLAVVCTRLALS